MSHDSSGKNVHNEIGIKRLNSYRETGGVDKIADEDYVELNIGHREGNI